MRIALYMPEIAGNVGTILRLGACLGAAIDLIEPMGFPWSDRALARAGMDYAERTRIARHADWDLFLQNVHSRIVLFTTHAAQRIDSAQFAADDILLFGSEGGGVPEQVHARADMRIRIPLRPGCRSLNLAVAAGIGLAEALRQTGSYPDD